MGTAKWLVSLTAAACMALLLGHGAAFGQLDGGGQKCVNAMIKDGGKVAATKGKDNSKCIGSAAKGGGSAASCISANSSKVTAAAGKVDADYSKNCAGAPPAFGLPGVPAGTAAAISAAGSDEEAQLAFAVYGSDVEISGDKTAGKCQSTVSKTYEKALATYMKGFGGCVKGALKSNGDEADMEACVLDDAKGKGAAAIGKIEAGIGKACAGLDTQALFPGACANVGIALLSECVGREVRCTACRMQNRQQGLHANCDALDDGTENGSCAAGLPNVCVLGGDSFFDIVSPLGIEIKPTATGTMEVAIGGSDGVKPASCEIRDLEPLFLGGLGFVCIYPGSGCPPENVDCGGTTTGGVTINSFTNIGACTGNTDCDAKCSAKCASLGAPTAGSTVLANSPAGCRGFCSLSDNQACTLDSQCIATGTGNCVGQENAPLPNVCDCSCVDYDLGIGRKQGDVICNLSSVLFVESSLPCGSGNDVLIDVGNVCVPMTTAIGAVQFNNFDYPDNALGTDPILAGGSGNAVSCSTQNANDISGMNLQGGVGFYGSTIGDLNVHIQAICE